MGKTVIVRIDQTGPATSTARVRDHRISVDRPLERGGDDQGPMGGELILVGLGGCFAVVLPCGRSINPIKSEVSGQ